MRGIAAGVSFKFAERFPGLIPVKSGTLRSTSEPEPCGAGGAGAALGAGAGAAGATAGAAGAGAEPQHEAGGRRQPERSRSSAGRSEHGGADGNASGSRSAGSQAAGAQAWQQAAGAQGFGAQAAGAQGFGQQASRSSKPSGLHSRPERSSSRHSKCEHADGDGNASGSRSEGSQAAGAQAWQQVTGAQGFGAQAAGAQGFGAANGRSAGLRSAARSRSGASLGGFAAGRSAAGLGAASLRTAGPDAMAALRAAGLRLTSGRSSKPWGLRSRPRRRSRSSPGSAERDNAWRGTWPEHTCRKPVRHKPPAHNNRRQPRDFHCPAGQFPASRHPSRCPINTYDSFELPPTKNRYRSVKKLTIRPSPLPCLSILTAFDRERLLHTATVHRRATRPAESLPCSSSDGCVRRQRLYSFGC